LLKIRVQVYDIGYGLRVSVS